MKKQITAYITGIVNSYSRAIDRLIASGAPITSTNSFQAFKAEFTDLLEFVIDIPEEKTILDFNLALENENLKQSAAADCNRIIDLENELKQFEEANEYAAAINRKLNSENNKLIDEKQNLQIACSLLKERTDPKKMERLKLFFKDVK